ncbi:MAG TPA: ATP-binding protein [Chitinophagaceae bacterium]|nr:ATP-binding protein [Chitinophagaceae bacterium]
MNLTTISRTKPVRYFPGIHKALPKPSAFGAALTHEVRNPLTNINLAVEMLQRMNPSEGQQDYLDIILRASKRINVLVSELLVKQPKLKSEGGSSVQQVLEEVLTMAGDRLRLKNILVQKDYSLQDQSIIEKHPGIKIALTNIIINAIDAMKENGGVLRLVTTSLHDHYHLRIEDNGCGIAPGDIQNIFRPFFTRKTGGLGVGLAVAAQILKANKVKIDVESEEGKGTKFILSFKKSGQLI